MIGWVEDELDAYLDHTEHDPISLDAFAANRRGIPVGFVGHDIRWKLRVGMARRLARGEVLELRRPGSDSSCVYVRA